MDTKDIFKIQDLGWRKAVSLAWDDSKKETMYETKYVKDPESVAIGRLWQKHGQEIISHIFKSLTDKLEAVNEAAQSALENDDQEAWEKSYQMHLDLQKELDAMGISLLVEWDGKRYVLA
jgi:hypothetical protein